MRTTHDSRTRTPPHGDGLRPRFYLPLEEGAQPLTGDPGATATQRAMAGPEIPHNEAGVPIIPDRATAEAPTLDDILHWLSAEAAHWDKLRAAKDVLGRDAAYRMYQTNLIWHRLDEWRDTGTEPNHGLK